jgi:glycosyltransferase involved in cell wall biosynthesis
MPNEVVVVDSGSRDGTVEVAQAYGARVISLPKIEGRFDDVGLARQRGTEEAMGNIIVSTDADVTHPPDWLDKIERHFEDNSRLVLLGGPSIPLDRSVVNDFFSMTNFVRSWWAGWGVPVLSGQNTSFSREAFMKTEGYKGIAAHGPIEEWVVSMRVARLGEWAWDDDLPVYIKIPVRRQVEAMLPAVTLSPLAAWAAATAAYGVML